MPYYIYILLCKDNTLYTGITNKLSQRLAQHRRGTGAKYTRGRSPLTLVYLQTSENRSLAQIEEARIKKLTRPEKNHLIQTQDKTLLQEYLAEIKKNPSLHQE